MADPKNFFISIFSCLPLLVSGMAEAGIGIGCIDSVTLGINYLYWNTCISDMQYAVEGVSAIGAAENELKDHYLDPGWDSGVRASVTMQNFWGCFNGRLSYTNYKTDASASTSRTVADILKLTDSGPAASSSLTGNKASAKFDLHFDYFEGSFSYPLGYCPAICTSYEGFGGIQWLSLRRHRKDILQDTLGDNTKYTVKHKVDFTGFGPLIGVLYSHKLCDCLYLDGSLSSGLLLGDADKTDRYKFDNTSSFDQKYKSKDDCVCFAGWHFKSGVKYAACWCGCSFDLHVGYEYTQWINAPSYKIYENEQEGTISGSSQKDVTLQGLYAGLDFSF